MVPRNVCGDISDRIGSRVLRKPLTTAVQIDIDDFGKLMRGGKSFNDETKMSFIP